jgi:hypothetical protein
MSKVTIGLIGVLIIVIAVQVVQIVDVPYWLSMWTPIDYLTSQAKVSAEHVTVQSGQSFTEDIRISSNTPLRGAQLQLSFDPALVQIDQVTEGSFFKDWAQANQASTMFLPQPTVDNTQGTVSSMALIVAGGNSGGVTGSGVLCTVHGVTKSGACGVSSINLNEVMVADANANSMKPWVEQGQVAVGDGLAVALPALPLFTIGWVAGVIILLAAIVWSLWIRRGPGGKVGKSAARAIEAR